MYCRKCDVEKDDSSVRCGEPLRGLGSLALLLAPTIAVSM